ncbi:hypothetical protein SLEP1_g17263 [Rubroshorea leprosula]|uniref:Uncharacterized protein n=1 Tax=Rubroshorea leprosula TaxID=152421 RepID=A0AAV5IXE7_9ROSI|nr:hypothetical protein SLEP1_g17263 [Rubroshorea leprosula]
MGRLRAKSDYEDLRKARILENQARLASLGLHKTLSYLRSLASVAKSQKTPVRKYEKKAYGITPLRRSNRLKRVTAYSIPTNNSLRRSNRLRDKSREDGVEKKDHHSGGRGDEKSLANMPLVKIEGQGAREQLSPEILLGAAVAKPGALFVTLMGFAVISAGYTILFSSITFHIFQPRS